MGWKEPPGARECQRDQPVQKTIKKVGKKIERHGARRAPAREKARRIKRGPGGTRTWWSMEQLRRKVGVPSKEIASGVQGGRSTNAIRSGILNRGGEGAGIRGGGG